ncbi:MAG: type II toxin-antitoxin system Phd/YefM family antitoxin [candidate division NC10 bacterium]|nr:type II toxin-antitoxin system Phd/YefM family antitoxin [candidate division NC10 bacterium]
MNKVLNITAARARLTRLVQEAFLDRKRILIAKHGIPMAALLPIAEYEELLQDLEDLRDMQEAEADYRRTGGKKLEEVVKALKARR